MSVDAARTLAAALLQLNPLLGLTLVWTESHLQANEKALHASERSKKTAKQTKSEEADPARKNEWALFIIFLHSITWTLYALVIPATITIDIALAVSIIWLLISAGRIIRTFILPTGATRQIFLLAMASTGTPLIILLLLIRVAAK